MELILTERGLPELLHYEDRNSMAHSLEARVPFLDYRLVELCFSLPPTLLIDRGVTKVALRRALADLMPPLVRDRIDKLGFVTPEGRWMRQGLGKLAADVFASKAFADRGFIDPKAAQKRLEAHRSGEARRRLRALAGAQSGAVGPDVSRCAAGAESVGVAARSLSLGTRSVRSAWSSRLPTTPSATSSGT